MNVLKMEQSESQRIYEEEMRSDLVTALRHNLYDLVPCSSL